MLRQIVVPEHEQLGLESPDDYLHQPVEVIVFRVNEADAGARLSEPEGELDLSLFRQYRERYDGKFKRDELYDRPSLS